MSYCHMKTKKNDLLDALGDAMTTILTKILTTTLMTNFDDQSWRPGLMTNFDDQSWRPILTNNLDKPPWRPTLTTNLDHQPEKQPWWSMLMTNLDNQPWELTNLDDQPWRPWWPTLPMFQIFANSLSKICQIWTKHQWLSHSPTWIQQMLAHRKDNYKCCIESWTNLLR